MVKWLYRDSIGAATDLIPLFTDVLEQCNLHPNQRLLIYADHHSPDHYAKAFMAAGQRIGADVFQLVIPTQQPDVMAGPIWDMWHSVDLVVDLESIMTSVYRPLRVSALEAGTRVLRVTEPEDVLFRLPPDPSVRQHAERGADRLKHASTMRVTSPAGTDLTVNVTNRQAFGLWGLVPEPGMWGHWPTGLVVGGANRPQTDGTLVIDVGDILLVLGHYVASPITITIADGVITDISGGVDAAMLRQWFAAANDPRAYYISHVGWGCDPRADWNRLAQKGPGGTCDVESHSGVFQIAFGRNTSWYIGDGINDVAAHIDFIMLRHSITLDGKVVSKNGVLIDAIGP